MQQQEYRALSAELKNNLSQLKDKRSNWETHWQEVAVLIIPRKSDIVDQKVRGVKRNIQVYDGTAIHSLELLASSLHGMLTSSATRWFELRFKEAVLNENDESKEWLEDVTELMYVAFQRSNFQQEIFETYHDLCSFGTAAMFIEADENDIIRFSSRHIKEIYISEDARGLVNCIYRRFKLSAKAAIDKFGFENVSRQLQNLSKKNPFDEVDLCHIVKPRDVYDPKKKDQKNMPFVSIYMEMENEHLISISGFNEFPYVVPRYLKASNEIYGRSPAMSALPDVKVLQKMVEVSLKAAQKSVDPPLIVPDDSSHLPIRTSPGSLIYTRSGSRDEIKPLQIGANANLGFNMEEQRRKAISQTFHVDQLLVTENRNMTATEVAQRAEEKARILGPTLGRLQVELLNPTIIRVFNIMLRSNLFRPAPEILANQEIDIEYVSPAALAQKSQELSSIIRGLEIFASIGQVAPVTDYLDPRGLVKEIIKILGIPAKVIRSDAEVQQITEEKQAAQQQQMEMMNAVQESQVAKNVAPAVQAINEADRQQ